MCLESILFAYRHPILIQQLKLTLESSARAVELGDSVFTFSVNSGGPQAKRQSPLPLPRSVKQKNNGNWAV